MARAFAYLDKSKPINRANGYRENPYYGEEVRQKLPTPITPTPPDTSSVILVGDDAWLTSDDLFYRLTAED